MVERSSSDAGAPVLSGSDRDSVRKVLRAVLVTGYGDQPGLGWSVAYESVGSTSVSGKIFLKSPPVAGRPDYYVFVRPDGYGYPVVGIAGSTAGVNDYTDAVDVLTVVYASTVNFAEWHFTFSNDARFFSWQFWDGDDANPDVFVFRVGDVMESVTDGSVNTRHTCYAVTNSTDIFCPKDPFYGLYKWKESGPVPTSSVAKTRLDRIVGFESPVSRVPSLSDNSGYRCPWASPYVWMLKPSLWWNVNANVYEAHAGTELYVRPSGEQGAYAIRMNALKLGNW